MLYYCIPNCFWDRPLCKLSAFGLVPYASIGLLDIVLELGLSVIAHKLFYVFLQQLCCTVLLCLYAKKNDDSYFDKSILSSMQHLDAIIYVGITRSQD